MPSMEECKAAGMRVAQHYGPQALSVMCLDRGLAT